jgi:hypothetical protein
VAPHAVGGDRRRTAADCAVRLTLGGALTGLDDRF